MEESKDLIEDENHKNFWIGFFVVAAVGVGFSLFTDRQSSWMLAIPRGFIFTCAISFLVASLICVVKMMFAKGFDKALFRKASLVVCFIVSLLKVASFFLYLMRS